MGLLHLTGYRPPLQKARAGVQGRHLEAVTDAETIEDGGLLACSATFLIQPRLTYTGIDTAHCRLGPPASISNKELPHSQCDQGNSSIEHPSS